MPGAGFGCKPTVAGHDDPRWPIRIRLTAVFVVMIAHDVDHQLVYAVPPLTAGSSIAPATHAPRYDVTMVSSWASGFDAWGEPVGTH
jgi:hypothetical protein